MALAYGTDLKSLTEKELVMIEVEWLRRKFIPSRSLALYVIKLYGVRFLLMLTLLVIILQSLDLLNRSDDIMDAAGDSSALLQYVVWRLPQLISQFIPFAALLAALFSFYSLANHSEVVIMRASGMAPGQVIAPMIIVGFLIAGGHYVFHDQVTVPSSVNLRYWQDDGYRLPFERPGAERTDIWLSDDRQVLEAGTATRFGTQVILDKVYIYTPGVDGLISESIAAELAIYAGGKWTLYNVRRFDLEGHMMNNIERLPWSFGLPTNQIFAQVERPDLVRAGSLSKAIKILQDAGAETFGLQTSWHHRLAQALSSVMMPLMAIFVGFGVVRGGARIGRVVIGMATGFSYFVFDNYLVAMGSMGVVPPLMASYSALGIFILAGFGFLARLD